MKCTTYKLILDAFDQRLFFLLFFSFFELRVSFIPLTNNTPKLAPPRCSLSEGFNIRPLPSPPFYKPVGLNKGGKESCFAFDGAAR